MMNLPRIKGVKYVHPLRRGKRYTYAYHRATGERIASAIGTPQFFIEIAELDNRAAAHAQDNAPGAGTLGALIKAYRASPEFQGLGDRTKADYQDVFDYLQRIDDMALKLIDAPAVLDLRDKAFAKHKRRFANYVVQVLRLLLAWGVPRRHGLAHNAAAGVPMIRRPRHLAKKNRAWKQHEKAAVLDALAVHVRWPIAIAMHAGLREGDLVAAPRTAWTGEAIDLEAQRKTAHPHWMPASADLKTVWRDYKKWLDGKGIVPIKLCVNSRGQAWTESGLRSVFFKTIRALIKAKAVEPGLTIHGLRHTIGRDVVDAGGDSRTAAAMIGDVSSAMGDHYSREADRKRRAADGAKKITKFRAKERASEREQNKILEKQADAEWKNIPHTDQKRR